MTRKKPLHEDENQEQENKDIIDNKDNNSYETENYEVKDYGTGSADENSGPDEVSQKETKKEVSAEEKLAEMQDRYLRLSAEFDNYRKRTLREKMDLTKHAGENILMSIVPVMDDFERAMKLMEAGPDCAAMKSGIDLIYNKFGEFLKQQGIKEIESLNQIFNVDLHEAVTKVPVQDDAMKGRIVEVIVKGYWLHDKVMRHSKVVVGE